MTKRTRDFEPVILESGRWLSGHRQHIFELERFECQFVIDRVPGTKLSDKCDASGAQGVSSRAAREGVIMRFKNFKAVRYGYITFQNMTLVGGEQAERWFHGSHFLLSNNPCCRYSVEVNSA